MRYFSCSLSIKSNLLCFSLRYLQRSKEFEFAPNNEIPNPLTCFFLTRNKDARKNPSIMDIAASVAPNNICMFRSPMTSPSHSPSMKRRSETGPADLRHPHPDGLPTRRVSSVDVTSIQEKLERLRQGETNNNIKRRRTTVASLCPVFRSSHFKRDDSISENDNDEDEDEETEPRGDINGGASLIGMDEESLTELVELTQKIDSTL